LEAKLTKHIYNGWLYSSTFEESQVLVKGMTGFAGGLPGCMSMPGRVGGNQNSNTKTQMRNPMIFTMAGSKKAHKII
jgi:hypothetical protein